MNGKKAKLLRTIARMETTEDSDELVKVKGTKRVRTADNGNKVTTNTLAYPLGSYRNVLKFWKSRLTQGYFNPETNNHSLVV